MEPAAPTVQPAAGRSFGEIFKRLAFQGDPIVANGRLDRAFSAPAAAAWESIQASLI